MASQWQCRLCLSNVLSNHRVSLMSKTGKKQDWIQRIVNLLGVQVASDDSLPQHICAKCCRRVEKLEKCAIDLESFQLQASQSYKTLLDQRSQSESHKRPKETSGAAVDLTPDTLRERPPAKRGVGMRKRLDFGQESFDLCLVRSDSVPESSPCEEILTEDNIALHCEEILPEATAVGSDETQVSTGSSETPDQQECSAVPTKAVTITISTPTRPDWTRNLPDEEAKIGRALAGGNITSFAKAVMSQNGIRKEILELVLHDLESECASLCKRSAPSRFRKMGLQEMIDDFQWERLMSDLRTHAPLLLRILTSIVSTNDHRNKNKAGAAHYPGICMAMAVILKERNREMCGIQSLVSLLLFSTHVEKKVYSRLNHLNICISYSATLPLIGQVSKLHKNPIQKWIKEGTTFKFIGDNVDKKRRVRDVRSDNQGEMLHMYSVLAARSRLPSSDLSHSGEVADLLSFTSKSFLPSSNDIEAVKSNLVTIVSRFLTFYIRCLAPLSKAVPKHIVHKYSKEMGKMSEVVVLDVLMKNEACGPEMIDIMQSLQGYLGNDYSLEEKVLSGGDQLTCERQESSQRHMMDGKTNDVSLQLLEPQLEDWHTLVITLTAAWKCLYNDKKHSSRDHGTLGYFKSRLNRTTVPSKPKKEVNATLDFFLTVVKGHLVAAACDILGISSPDSPLQLPSGIIKGTLEQQSSFVTSISTKVVDRVSLIGVDWTKKQDYESGDGVYNYARVLCHFGGIVLEFYDAWAEGDGDRIYRCYRLLMPHFICYGHTKYALQALRFQFQVAAYLSPHLAHHIVWDRFINTRGGIGCNIPCDLHNEHVNKLIKEIVGNMGSNLTEEALQRAARSVTALQNICKSFDKQSGVPTGSSYHFTRYDAQDVAKVASVVRDRKLLYPIAGRKHSSCPNFSLDPLNAWDREKTHEWIEKKQTLFANYQGAGLTESDEEECDSDED